MILRTLLLFLVTIIIANESTELTIKGCTNESACNYNEDANMDDNSCDFESCLIKIIATANIQGEVDPCG